MPRLHFIEHASLASWSIMIGVGALWCVLCLHFIWYRSCKTWPLRPSCIIDGPRVEGHAPLSPLHDRECARAYICLKFHAIHCLSLLLSKTSFCREFLPTGTVECRPAMDWWLIIWNPSRWISSMAGGYSLQPMVSYRVQGTCPRTLAVFKEVGQCKQRQQWYGTGFRGKINPSMHHSRIPRRGLRPSSLCI